MIIVSIILPFILFVIYIERKMNIVLNILQINSYKNKKMVEHYKEKFSRIAFKEILLIISIIPVFFLRSVTAGNIILSLVLLFLILTTKNKNYKKPLVNTDRIKRLSNLTRVIIYGISAIFVFFLSINFEFILLPEDAIFQSFTNEVAVIYVLVILVYFIFSVFLARWVSLSNILLKPVESAINNKFYKEAEDKIKAMDKLKIIGVTGSYGKTSTKYILSDILSEKYNVCRTPGSYNTLLGVVRTIREELKPTDNIFVVEMGARQKNDIKEICDLVKPQYGIITAIGSQHLETFKSVENIKETKYELIRGLEGEKVAFLNIDNEHLRDIVAKEKLNEMQHETVCYSLENKDADYYAENIRYTNTGAIFDVCTQKGEKIEIKTKLLGLYNIYNVLAGVAIANRVGMTLPEIARGASSIKPVEHRLELKKSSSNITVIDDAFNANPEGTKEALEVLKRMEGNKKIIVTPGMVELGNKQYQLNMEFGEKCARTCDYTIMVGYTQTKPMQDAFRNMGISDTKYYVAKDLNDATKKLNEIIEAGDVVLYENDLPEDY